MWEVVEEPDWPPRREPKPPRPNHYVCPGCEASFDSARPAVYCSLRCRLDARTVRYHRSVQARFQGDPPADVRRAMATKFAHAVGGSYDERKRRIRPNVRAAVVARAQGSCELCGDPGAEVDHKSGPSSDLTNLQYLCAPCHHHKTGARFRPMREASPEQKRRALRLEARINAPAPLRPCDEPGWDWASWRLQPDA